MGSSQPLKLWRPSNATQGDAFMRDWCGTCAHDFKDSESCDINMRTMAFDMNEPEYPSEWCYNPQGEPVCTAYILKSEPIPSPRDDRTIDMFEGEDD